MSDEEDYHSSEDEDYVPSGITGSHTETSLKQSFEKSIQFAFFVTNIYSADHVLFGAVAFTAQFEKPGHIHQQRVTAFCLYQFQGDCSYFQF